ncbi:NAD(P)H-quinone oxidoreductase [Candidatus Enterococcus ikei]|uniref:NAD(P)H-quinone oxidoreductase n=1 Tax=Candidatus Enterococcus ikei TaxID=2815326 RepID=A0ABS3H1U0_9ENTE|nr:NAD(P)H-quinone oxidoreductase [Enterococcus sp. DIV0869a]MBO0440961.1 NAD(P)H-quinone oxidoreductase [Enterococcus sp. DIV0869a]
MKAIELSFTEKQAKLELNHEVDLPKRTENQLLIKVEAAAINRTDLMAKETGKLPKGSSILGVEVSGIVIESDSELFPQGSRVMGLVNGGGYAEYAVMNIGNAMPLSEQLTFEEGAAIPEVFLTAYQTLFLLGELKSTESVLIHAGASGVGTAAIQLVKQLTSAKIFVTAGTPEKLEFCRSLGADILINYKEEAFPQIVQKETEGKGVDLILDFVGASYWESNLASIAYDGRLILIGILGGSLVKEVNLMTLLEKRITVKGTMLTPRSDAYKAELTKEFLRKTTKLFESGQLKPIVDSVFLLENVEAAHQYMLENKNKGKIILKINE